MPWWLWTPTVVLLSWAVAWQMKRVGQVLVALERTRDELAEYKELLRERDKRIAKLEARPTKYLRPSIFEMPEEHVIVDVEKELDAAEDHFDRLLNERSA